MSVERVNLTPPPRLLFSMFHSSMTHPKALAELVDNAFDAGASSVAIEFGRSTQSGATELTVRDNGAGCADLGAMIRVGDREHHPGTKLGRYGIGAKDAATWEGGERSTFRVQSTVGGITRLALVDWHVVATSAAWPDVEIESRGATSGELGTVLRIAPVIRRVPSGAEWERLRGHLGYLYAPGLARGRQILMGRGGRPAVPLMPWRLPCFDAGAPRVDATLEIGKRVVRVRCGIVAEGEPNPHPGLTYWHAFRVILESSSRGCGGYSTARIAGVVELDETWPLTRNKDDVSRDAEALEAGVFQAILPLLVRAQEQSIRLHFREMADAIGQRLEGMLGAFCKARRPGPHTRRGAIKDTGTGGPHRRARETQPGQRFRDSTGRAIRVDFVNLGTDEMAGRFNGSEVQLNTACAAVARAQQAGNEEALTMIAASLVADDFARRDANEQTTMFPDFSRSLGALLKAMHPVHAAAQVAQA